MSMLGDIADAFGVWIDAVARSGRAALDRFQPDRCVRIVEREAGVLSIVVTGGEEAGPGLQSFHFTAGSEACDLPQEWLQRLRQSRVEIVLQPVRFLFRPYELPKRASEFMEGIIRSQIDRLTPWNASEAFYKWTAPVASAGERITVTIIATARATLAPLIEAISDAGVASIELKTTTPEPVPAEVVVYSHSGRANAQIDRIRQVLIMLFAVSGIAALGAMLVSGFLSPYYDDQLEQAQKRVADRRALARAGTAAGSNSALDLLERRKQSSPSSVMVLEALSALLPDHTYATEMRIDGDKVQVVGLSSDAPSLIKLLEQSPHFAQASFFAPTTRAPGDPAERFHIEAKIKPYFGSGS